MTPALPGQKLSIRADEWNRVRQAASLVTGSVAGRTDAAYTPAEIVLVKNSTASAFARFAPVGISTRLDISIDNPPALTGVAVSSSSAKSYGVCQEPIPAGGIGRVAVGGVFLARVATTAGAGPAEAGIDTATSNRLTATGTELRVKLLHTDPVDPDPQSSPPSNTGVFWVRPLGGSGETGSDVRVVRITGKFSTAVGGKYLAEAYPMSPESEDAWTSTSEIIPAEMLGTSTVDAIFMNVIEFGIGGSDYLAWDDVTDTDNIYGVGVVVGTISTGTYAGYLIIAGIAFKPNVCSA